MGEQALRKAFMAALPDRLVGLEMAYEQWRLSQQDAEQALEQFYRLSHNLAGAAALYGFEQVSAPCRALECYLLPLLRDSGANHTGGDEGITRLLGAIRGIVRQLQQEDARRTG